MGSGGSGRRAIVGLWLITAAIGSCARTPRPCGAIASNAPPTAARRDHCLAPPWTIDPQRPASGVEGWSAAACDGRSGKHAYFIHDGPRKLTDGQVQAVQRALVAFVGGSASTGIGGCCGPEIAAKTQVVCLKVWLGVCNIQMSQIVAVVDGALRERGLADGHIGVSISAGGRVGPRCEPTDPVCGPLDDSYPAGPGVRSEPGCEAERWPIDGGPLTSSSGRISVGACAHDGECVIDNCESRCAPWNMETGGMSTCDDQQHHDKESAYCGCVSGRCAWFRPARR